MSYTVSILEYNIEKKKKNRKYDSILSPVFIASNNNPRSDALLNLQDFLQGDKKTTAERRLRGRNKHLAGWGCCC